MFALDPPENLMVVVVSIKTSEHQDVSSMSCTGVCNLFAPKIKIDR